MPLNTNHQDCHPLLPRGTHDERARQEFVKSLHERASGLSRAEASWIYRGRVVPEFQARYGRAPATRAEARGAMERDPFWQTVVGLRRTAQELLWSSVIDTVEREGPALISSAREYADGPGSLRLSPGLPMPDYLTAVDFHAMPGSYHSESATDDVCAGAIFERGTFLYTHGYIGPMSENLGRGMVDFVRRKHPDWQPRRILDMGCGIGSCTLPWVDAFPAAEIHGIDVAAPGLRYGHARANALGKAVQFSQQNAERTDFPDGHFDLVVSHILLHETSREAIVNIFRESFRLLAPGGRMVHADLPDIRQLPDLFQQVSIDQDHYDNNEPLWAGYYDLDLMALLQAAGFPSETIAMESAGMLLSLPPSSASPERNRTVTSRFGYGVTSAQKATPGLSTAP